jgi:XTP/dITP diphosphohydrolase
VAVSPARPQAERLVLATANEGKRREFEALLADLPFEVMTQASLGVPSAEETGSSFLDNALLKARHVQAHMHRHASPHEQRELQGRVPGASSWAVLADDSGLEVDALGGAPGIYSARYAGPRADDAANNAKLIEALRGVSAPRRTARYRCVLVFLAADRERPPLIAEGVWEGRILEAPRGAGGFGYDPYFFLPDRGVSAAELDPAEKNRLSHRGVALRELRRQLAPRFA